MYKPKYGYSAYPGFSDFLKNLYDKSYKRYMDTVAKESTPSEQKRDLNKITEYINYVEDFIYGLVTEDYVTTANVGFVIDQIKQLETIIPIEKAYRGVYGVTRGNDIAINPTLSASPTLTSDERTKLYVFHELGHLIHAPWMDDIDTYRENLKKDPKLAEFFTSNPVLVARLIYYGFSLFDEATVQETAEDLVYKQSGKKRPNIIERQNPKIYSGEPYRSNFDYYGPLHEPTILFARTLKDIGTTSDTPDDQIMHEFAKNSFKRNFLNDIVSEYNETPELKMDLLFTMLHLGWIKDATYSMFGAGTIQNSPKKSLTSLNSIKEVCGKNEDYRQKPSQY